MIRLEKGSFVTFASCRESTESTNLNGVDFAIVGPPFPVWSIVEIVDVRPLDDNQ
jgi:hypothetical protein